MPDGPIPSSMSSGRTAGGASGAGSGGNGPGVAGPVLHGMPRSVLPRENVPHSGTPQNPDGGQGEPCRRRRRDDGRPSQQCTGLARGMKRTPWAHGDTALQYGCGGAFQSAMQ